MNRDALLKVATGWYKGASVREFLDRALSRDDEDLTWYEAARTQQLDGSYVGKYYICTSSKLLILVVTAMQIELRSYPLSALQKVTGSVPYSPGHQAIWPQSDWTCRFLVGSEPETVKIDFPERDEQIQAYSSVLQRLT